MKVGWRVGVTVALAVVAFGLAALIGVFSDNVDVDRAFSIDRFDRAVLVDADGTTRVQEVIDVTFHTSRRGIFRDLPDERRFPAGNWTIHTVDQGTDNQPWPATLEDGPDGPRIRIGDANQWLNPGTYRYRIRMTAPTFSHRLTNQPDLVDTRIDVPGYDWPTTITTGTFAIGMPGDGVYQGVWTGLLELRGCVHGSATKEVFAAVQG